MTHSETQACEINDSGELYQLELSERKIFTVSELTEEIRKVLEGTFPMVWVKGEISNFKRAPSGHTYLTLKDDNSQIRCVMFKHQSKYLKFQLEDGLKILASGRVNVYSPRGEYQLILETMEPVGLGSLMLALEQLKTKLASEGLFDSSRKKPLPRRPGTVGVVTSATGAAVRDIIRIIKRRSPGINILISPTSVQGDKAPEEIVSSLQRLVISGKPDVIIIGRGGGSIEDLWAFNDESVVRAVASCSVPIVSAVGHETDFTLSDFAADARASTPSAAAEIIAPDDRDAWDSVTSLIARLKNGIRVCLTRSAQTLDDLTKGFEYPLRRIQDERSRIEDLTERIRKSSIRMLTDARKDLVAMSGRLRPEILMRKTATISGDLGRLVTRLERSTKIIMDDSKSRVTNLAARLDALSPFRVLARGYTITFRTTDGTLLRGTGDVDQGEDIRTVVSGGSIVSRVVSVDPTPMDSTTFKKLN
ncbi:MAG: exodeoxyribonuclease VII large subunit [Desulfomonilaceae bacterium]